MLGYEVMASGGDSDPSHESAESREPTEHEREQLADGLGALLRNSLWRVQKHLVTEQIMRRRASRMMSQWAREARLLKVQRQKCAQEP